MNLVQLIYASRATVPVTADLLETLLTESQPKNAAAEITGVLTASDASFLQLLEGDYQQVNRLYYTLLADTRHTAVTLVYYRSVSERICPTWRMVRAASNETISTLVSRYLDGSTSMPIESFGRACVDFFEKTRPDA